MHLAFSRVFRQQNFMANGMNSHRCSKSGKEPQWHYKKVS